MAESSGFFRSVGGDRKYTVDFLAKWVASFLSNGVYTDALAVTADANMQVLVPSGQAWINGYYYRSDADIPFQIRNADGVLNRKDTVVLRWDLNDRSISTQILTGAPASNPVAPAIVRTAEQYDLKLAEISIPAGTTAITQSLITDTRLNTDVCGIVHAVVDHIDTTTFYNQIAADLAEFKSTNEADFTTWVAGLKDVLDESTAGNLLNLIDEHKADTVAHMTQAQKDQLAAAVPNSRKINGHALTGDVTVTKSDLGLGNVDNTADANKSVNYANSAGYAGSAGSAPANGGTAEKASYASGIIAGITAALRNAIIIPNTSSVPTGLPDNTIVVRYTP